MIRDVAVHLPTLTIQRAPTDFHQELLLDAARGLAASPKELSPKWFYDPRGSALFEAITRQPEYYLTARERQILLRHSTEIAEISRAEVLVELGSGTSEKTRVLLRSLTDAGHLRCFVPFDLDEKTLRMSAETLAGLHPALRVHAVVGDFERDLHLLPRSGRRLIGFLGSTIGNLRPPARAAFFKKLAAQMSPDDTFLLGTDLVKSVRRLHAAYNDAGGVTAEFNRNILLVLNRELRANFVPARFEHVARFDRQQEWIEMLLRSSFQQRVRVPKLAMEVSFGAGEEMRTEISAKFRRPRLEAELRAAGLQVIRWWMDPRRDYALSLSVLRAVRIS